MSSRPKNKKLLLGKFGKRSSSNFEFTTFRSTDKKIKFSSTTELDSVYTLRTSTG